MEHRKYIVVEGLVKSGKTSLAKTLAARLEARLILDQVENPFLDDFHSSLAENLPGPALKTQLLYLMNRYYQQHEIKQKDLFQKITVSDYLFFRDGIYAHSLLNDDDLQIYKKIFAILSEKITPPDMVIYLQTSFQEMLNRIQKTSGNNEKRVPTDYWRDIFEAYNYYFFNYKQSPLMVVNVEKNDFSKPADLDNLIRELNSIKSGISYYAPL